MKNHVEVLDAGTSTMLERLLCYNSYYCRNSNYIGTSTMLEQLLCWNSYITLLCSTELTVGNYESHASTQHFPKNVNHSNISKNVNPSKTPNCPKRKPFHNFPKT